MGETSAHFVNLQTDRPTLCQEAEQALSAARLRAYQGRGEPDTFNAIARYLWNAALCEALYPMLQAFEVALRNAIHDSLSEYYRPEWLLDPHLFRRKEWEAILKAQTSLAQQGKPVANSILNPDDLVAELMLGFWTGLFVHAYDRSVVLPVIRRRLKGFPSVMRTRDGLYKRFDRVRFLRNRVAHHEAIWHWQDLPQRHADIVDYTRYLNPTLRDLTALVDRFEVVHTAGWKHYRTRLGDELLKPMPPAGTAP